MKNIGLYKLYKKNGIYHIQDLLGWLYKDYNTLVIFNDHSDIHSTI